MRNNYLLTLAVVLTLAISTWSEIQAQKPEVVTTKSPGDTTVLFTVKTVSYGGAYAPKHVMAIWITNSSNQYITTLKLNGLNPNYRNKLFKWKTYIPTLATPPATADCITGATLSTHSTQTVKWSGKDASGVRVPDGNYNLWVEFNETNLSNNPSINIPFTIGNSDQHITPANTSYFQNIDLNYFYYPGVGIDESFIGNTSVSIFPNPSSDNTTIQVELKKSASVQVTIYSMTGKVVHRFKKGNYSEGNCSFVWNPESDMATSGTYFVHISVGQKNQVFKLIIN